MDIFELTKGHVMQVHQKQVEFFRQIGKKINSHALLAEEMAQTLDISKSEAYNKISGKSQVTITQVETLCNKYNVSFEINPAANLNCCNVKFTPFHTGAIDIGKYLELLNNTMLRLSAGPLKKITCATDDIPFYHMFKYPELTAFKLHFWNNRIAKNSNMPSGQTFDFKAANKKDLRTAYELHNMYKSVPCVEIWTKSHLLITIDQVSYAAESHVLKDKELGRIICEQLVALFQDVESYAIRSSKTEDGNGLFDWYFCDVVGGVTYLAETAEKRFCFLRFNTFNNVESDNEALCREVDMWLQSLLNDATGFSGHASKYRNAYLEDALKTCHNLAAKF